MLEFWLDLLAIRCKDMLIKSKLQKTREFSQGNSIFANRKYGILVVQNGILVYDFRKLAGQKSTQVC